METESERDDEYPPLSICHREDLWKDEEGWCHTQRWRRLFCKWSLVWQLLNCPCCLRYFQLVINMNSYLQHFPIFPIILSCCCSTRKRESDTICSTFLFISASSFVTLSWPLLGVISVLGSFFFVKFFYSRFKQPPIEFEIFLCKEKYKILPSSNNFRALLDNWGCFSLGGFVPVYLKFGYVRCYFLRESNGSD